MKTCAMCAAWAGREPGTHPTSGTCFRFPPAFAFHLGAIADYPTKQYSETACESFVEPPAE